MTGLKRISAVLALTGALAAAGCGGEDDEGSPIPADRAGLLEERLDETERRLANGSVGACEDILNDTRPEVENLLASLPADVEDRDALEASFDNLWALVDTECAQRQDSEEEAPEPDPVQEPTETEPPPETDTEPEEEEPPPPEEEEPLPPVEEEELPPGQGGEIPGQGGGGGLGPEKGDDE